MPHPVILGTSPGRFAPRAFATLPLGTASQALGPIGMLAQMQDDLCVVLSAQMDRPSVRDPQIA